MILIIYVHARNTSLDSSKTGNIKLLLRSIGGTKFMLTLLCCCSTCNSWIELGQKLLILSDRQVRVIHNGNENGGGGTFVVEILIWNQSNSDLESVVAGGGGGAPSITIGGCTKQWYAQLTTSGDNYCVTVLVVLMVWRKFF